MHSKCCAGMQCQGPEGCHCSGDTVRNGWTLIASHNFIASQWLPEHLPEQQPAEACFSVPYTPTPGLDRGKYRYRNHVPNKREPRPIC
jgi:hypothetical protein